jgi:hypothetical protein
MQPWPTPDLEWFRDGMSHNDTAIKVRIEEFYQCYDLDGIPWPPIFHKMSLWTLSKTFRKSIHLMNKDVFHSMLSSIMLRR